MGSVTLNPNSLPNFPKLFTQTFTQEAVEGTLLAHHRFVPPTGDLYASVHSDFCYAAAAKSRTA
jgi:hypothetical protein